MFSSQLYNSREEPVESTFKLSCFHEIFICCDHQNWIRIHYHYNLIFYKQFKIQLLNVEFPTNSP